MLGLLAIGIALAAVAALLAQRYEIGPKLELDVRGAETTGTAEPVESGGYRIRYRGADGSRFARSYDGGFGWQRIGEGGGEIRIAYDPSDPIKFQPKTISYMPALGIFFMFTVGMWCVLRARRLAAPLRPGWKRKQRPSS